VKVLGQLLVMQAALFDLNFEAREDPLGFE
jgi:hypothetical protein